MPKSEEVEVAMDAHRQEVKLRKLKITPVKRKLSEEEINRSIMNMLKQKMNGHFDALDEEFSLWSALENNPPQWWKNLLMDKELYVEIRKDNYANVYYYGGNVALIRWTGGEFAAETHQKYLGDEKPVRTKTVKKKEKGEREVKVYEYRNCMDKLQTKEGLEEIKRHIRETYHDIHGKNGRQETKKARDRATHIYTSNEKSVQGELKLCFPNRYIDSELAYRVGKKELIRFDLVELREKKLVFVELKLITDSRLRVQEGEPEIIRQMTAYSNFISKHAEELKDYYSKLLRIKKRIGLWDGDIEIESISLKPELLIVNTYEKLTKGREERIAYMEKLKERTEFDTLIIGYSNLCK